MVVRFILRLQFQNLGYNLCAEDLKTSVLLLVKNNNKF